MPKPYVLTLFAPKRPETPNEIFNSADMNAYGLWAEFAELPHITMQFMSVYDKVREIPECDFALIHSYFGTPIYDRLPEIRTKTRCKIASILETYYNGINYGLIDHHFTFLPQADAEQIPLPCYRLLLGNSIIKTANTILLDHQWSNTDKHEDICCMLYKWLKLYNHPVAQLRRPAVEAIEIPIWVHSIPLTNYIDYLTQTASYETFIITHRGSYEHSIIDMAARGIRVLVPVKDGRTFCHPSMVKDMNLSTFSNREELFALLGQSQLPQQAQFTDMPDVVAKISAYYQAAK